MSIIADALKKAQRKGDSRVAPPPPFDLKREEGESKGVPPPPTPPSAASPAGAKAKKAPTATGAPRAVPVAKAKKAGTKVARRWSVRIPVMFAVILAVFAALIFYVNKIYLPSIQKERISAPPVSAPVAQRAEQEPSAAVEQEGLAEASGETTEMAEETAVASVQEADQVEEQIMAPQTAASAPEPVETGTEPTAQPSFTENLAGPAGITAGVEGPGIPTGDLPPLQGKPLAEQPLTDGTSVGIVQKDRDKEKELREDIYHFNMAVYFQRRNDIQSALLEYARVIELSPYNAEVYNNMGALYNQIGEYEKAVAVLQKALIIDPSYSKAHNNIGLVYYEGSHLERAQVHLARAIELAPADLESYNNLGLVYKKMNELDKAEEAFSRALAINPDYAAAHYNLALLYEETGRLEEARRHYNGFIAGGGGSPELNFKVQRRLQRLIQSKPGSSPDF